LKADFDKT